VAKQNVQVRVFGARGVAVKFGENEVVAGVDLELRAGEIHALVGENGAGKSSLAKAMAGVVRPSRGSIYLDDTDLQLTTPGEALQAGIALIHQEPLTFPDLTVAESIFVGHQPGKHGLVDWSAMRAKAQELLADLGLTLNPDDSVGGISIAQQQQVELASALAHDAQIWIFDETTAPLTPKETEELFAIMRRLRDRGCALMMVTHHLSEVFAVSDRITVLRDGHKVGERITTETSEQEIVGMMVGRELGSESFTPASHGEEVLVVQGLSGPGFRDVSFNIRAGEILGIGGLVGSGRTEIARVLFGIAQKTSGTIRLNGEEIAPKSPKAAIALGIALVPEDRRHDGLILSHAIEFNATLPILKRLSPKGWLRPTLLRERAKALADRTKLAYRGLDQPAGELSGGNQQKVVLSKWLMSEPKLLILDEPTRGVDVGAKHEVHTMIRKLADSGVAVLMISSDLPELLALSDRIVVMREGRQVKTLARSEANEESVMREAALG